jgi:uncharacterized protein (DUF4415 family)
LFDGRPFTTAPSPRNAEERWLSVGEIDGRVVAVAWCWRGAAIRIITMRRARDAENGDIMRYSDKQLAAKRGRGESRTDWTKADAMTEADLEASIAADPDEAHDQADWTHAVIGLPPRKQDIHIRLDADVLDWFKRTGKGYQTRINNVLRAFVDSRRHTQGLRTNSK